MNDDRLHLAGVDVDAPVERVFAFMSDPHQLKFWAVGLTEQQVVAPALVQGILKADGQAQLCELSAAPEQGIVVYRLGANRQSLAPRISALIVDGRAFGYAQTRLSLLAWRTADMGSDRWASLAQGHEAEVMRIKALIEQGDRTSIDAA